MNFLRRTGWGALALAAGLGCGSQAAAISAASANYVLERHAFTGGNPNAANPVTSANFVLAASSLGGISQGAATNAARKLYSGYLVPWDLLLTRPDLIRIAVTNGRVWLEWAAAGDPVAYTVESAPGLANFSPAATGLASNRWDAPLPVATSRFYRVRAVRAP